MVLEIKKSRLVGIRKTVIHGRLFMVAHHGIIPEKGHDDGENGFDQHRLIEHKQPKQVTIRFIKAVCVDKFGLRVAN